MDRLSEVFAAAMISLAVLLLTQGLAGEEAAVGARKLLEQATVEAEAVKKQENFIPAAYVKAARLAAISAVQRSLDPELAAKTFDRAREVVKTEGLPQYRAPLLAAFPIFEQCLAGQKPDPGKLAEWGKTLNAAKDATYIRMYLIQWGACVSGDACMAIIEHTPAGHRPQLLFKLADGLADWEPAKTIGLLVDGYRGRHFYGQYCRALGRATRALVSRRAGELTQTERELVAKAVKLAIAEEAFRPQLYGMVGLCMLPDCCKKVDPALCQGITKKAQSWAETLRPQLANKPAFGGGPSSAPAKLELFLAGALKPTAPKEADKCLKLGLTKLVEWRNQRAKWMDEKKPAHQLPTIHLDSMVGQLALVDPAAAEAVLAKAAGWKEAIPPSKCWAPLAIDAAYADMPLSNQYLKRLPAEEHSQRSLVLIHQARALVGQ